MPGGRCFPQHCDLTCDKPALETSGYRVNRKPTECKTLSAGAEISSDSHNDFQFVVLKLSSVNQRLKLFTNEC